MHAPPAGLQRLLLSPLDEGDVKSQGKYKLSSTSVDPYPGLEPKAGNHALKFSGLALSGGAKGDFVISNNIPGAVKSVGLWVYLAADSNVGKVGVQVTDSEGEMLMALVDATWLGWKWVEFDTTKTNFAPAFKQPEKNGMVDLPLKGINIVWFTKGGGPTSLGVDALAAVTQLDTVAEPYNARFITSTWGESGAPLQGQILIHNFSDKAIEFNIKATLQSNPNYKTPSLPDPVRGSDHAQGQSSWVEIGGQRIENASLTDHDDDTCYQPVLPKEGVQEIFQFVDLGKTHKITDIGLRPGDANWIKKIDVYVSEDGKNYSPVEDLQNLDLEKKWGLQLYSASKPFPARYIRLRYHNSGQNLPLYFRSLSSLLAFDGVEDEVIEIPTVGKKISEETIKVTVPPKAFTIASLKPTPSLSADAYLLGMEIEHDHFRRIAIADYFVMPSDNVKLRPESRFGINVSNPLYIPMLARFGFGWARFENTKWCFYNPGPDDFRFDGTVAPWNVPFDEYFNLYHQAGMSILPYIFETPEWAVSAPEEIKKNRRAYAPRELTDYGKAIFQAVARYGSNKVKEDELQTSDKQTGTNLINTYELWNEPNLHDPNWGFYVGPLSEYYKLFRAGAEAAKQADPQARVTNGGWAGLSMEFVDTMRSFHYPDGKTPLDFTDVLNIHFYAGKDDPETATKDPNAFREGALPDDIQTLEKDMIDLADWRDELKPAMPIWVTETGHDVGGPIGRTERHQAAKLPRGTMFAFANGIEKVFIYREVGSTPTQHAGAGLMRNDNSLRPSAFTMATLIRQFEGITETRVPRLRTGDPEAWVYFWKCPGENGDLLTAWAPKGSAKLGLDLGRCKVTNAFGSESEMEVTKDFQLGDFPVYISKISNTTPIETLHKEALQREEARKKRAVLESNAEAWLFDFGSREFIGTKRIGKVRPFIPVLLEDLYDSEKGYGFTTAVAGKNTVAHWNRSALEKDAIQLHKAATFAIQPKGGTYKIQLKGNNFAEGKNLVINGAEGGEVDIELPAGKNGAPTEPHSLTVKAGQPLRIEIPSGNLQWLTLIETIAP